MMTWRRLWDGLRLLGHALFYAVMIAVFASFIVLGIIGWVERDRPVYWGTFTATSVGLWFPWAAASLTAGAIWYYHRQWRRVGGKKDRSPPDIFIANHARDI